MGLVGDAGLRSAQDCAALASIGADVPAKEVLHTQKDVHCCSGCFENGQQQLSKHVML